MKKNVSLFFTAIRHQAVAIILVIILGGSMFSNLLLWQQNNRLKDLAIFGGYTGPVFYTSATAIDHFEGYTVEQVKQALTGYPAMQALAPYFTYYAWRNDVSVLYACAHAALESGYATSAIYVRTANLYGFGAFDRNPGYYAVSYSKDSSGAEGSIAEALAYVKIEYLTPGGKWYVKPTLLGVNTHYATDKAGWFDPSTGQVSIGWAAKIASIMNRFRYRITNAPNYQLANSQEWYSGWRRSWGDSVASLSTKLTIGQAVSDLYRFQAGHGGKAYASAEEWANSTGVYALQNWNDGCYRWTAYVMVRATWKQMYSTPMPSDIINPKGPQDTFALYWSSAMYKMVLAWGGNK
jgi:hypothetical protein